MFPASVEMKWLGITTRTIWTQDVMGQTFNCVVHQILEASCYLQLADS